MSSPMPDLDDAGIFAMTMLATTATAAGLSVAGYSLWFAVPAAVVWFVLGELAARKLATLKASGQEAGQ